MGLRFRKSFKIAPGIRLNLSKSGLGVSAGVRGARIGVNSRGTYTSVGIPGTGIYSTSYSKNGRKGYAKSSLVPTQTNASGGKSLLAITAVIVGIAVPLVGLIMACIAIIYFYKRSKSPKYQAGQRIKKAKGLFKDGKYDEAEPLLSEAKKLDSSNSEVDYLLGGALHNQHKYKQAAPYLETALKLDPTHDETIISLANCYFNLEQYNKAIPLIQNMPGGWESNLKSLQLLGLSFASLKKYDLAIDVFKKAPLLKRNLDSDLLELHYNLGLVYEKSGSNTNALKHFKKVYAYNAGYKDIHSKIESLEK